MGWGKSAWALSIAATLGIAAATQATACDIDGAFRQIVFNAIGEKRALTESSFGMTVIDRESGATLCQEFIEGDRNIYPASTMKTLIALTVLQELDDGNVSLEQEVAISQDNAAAECKHWDCDRYGPGKLRTVTELLSDMITVSNNIATNQLIDLVGKDEINAMADTLGAKDLRVYRKVYDDVDPEPEITTPNRATARALTEVYREIESGQLEVLSDSWRALMIDLLRHQKINGSLSRNFPSGVTFFHKPGNTSKVIGDGGFYYLDSHRAVVLVGLQNFTKFKLCDAERKCPTKTGFQSLRQIGKAALEFSKKL